MSSQLPPESVLADAVQLMAPEPKPTFRMPKLWDSGEPPCATAVKLSALCESRICAVDGLTVNVTGTTTVLPAPVTVTVPEYVPTVKLVGSAVTLSATGDVGDAVPLKGETLSQVPPPAVLVTVKGRVPPPVSWTCICWLTALNPTALDKLMLCVSTPSVGGLAAVTVSDTAMVAVGGVAADEVTVTVP
jgi:hypothetical protein